MTKELTSFDLHIIVKGQQKSRRRKNFLTFYFIFYIVPFLPKTSFPLLSTWNDVYNDTVWFQLCFFFPSRRVIFLSDVACRTNERRRFFCEEPSGPMPVRRKCTSCLATKKTFSLQSHVWLKKCLTNIFLSYTIAPNS